MNWYLVVRFLHIISAMVFIGGIFARQIVRAVAHRSNDVNHFALLSKAAGQIENLMVIPGNLAVISLGIVLALIVRAPILGFLQGSAQNWLLVSNLLLVLGLAMVPFIFIPRGKRFDLVLNDALSQQKVTQELRAALNDPVIRAVHFLEIVLVVFVVFLMIVKPF
jgi:uncharacterized membrane protein